MKFATVVLRAPRLLALVATMRTRRARGSQPAVATDAPAAMERQILQAGSGIAAAASLCVALALPVGYYKLSLAYMASHLAAHTELHARQVASVIHEFPEYWELQVEKLGQAIAPGSNSMQYVARILDRAGTPVTQEPAFVDVDWMQPALRRSAPIRVDGRVVGSVESEVSLRQLHRDTAQIAWLAVALGMVIYVSLHTGPLRSLRRALVLVRFVASHDPMTEMPNRTLFRDQVRHGLAHARRLNSRISVICLDLDHFKDVNDMLGHAAGDALLRQVAQRLKRCIRDCDCLARLSGDEFAIVQTDVRHVADAADLTDRLFAEMARPFLVGESDVQIGMSAGVSLSDPHEKSADDPAQLLLRADLALTRAKDAGRGRWCFFEEAMNQRRIDRNSLQRELATAILREEFEVYYQPQVQLDCQTLIGVEALVRWNHPARGLIGAVEFIPTAEATGQIIAIGEWVLRRACTELLGHRQLCLAVNLSPVQFRQPHLAKTVSRILADTGFKAGRLELEITEGILLTDTDSVLRTLTDLKTLGVRIAMDDFGTGYSSLAYLRTFPFDKVKIDRSFVSDLGKSRDAAAIVRAIVAMAQSLGIRTNAEGVECIDQLDALITEGCHEVQGYLFGRPMPAGELAALLAAPRTRVDHFRECRVA